MPRVSIVPVVLVACALAPASHAAGHARSRLDERATRASERSEKRGRRDGAPGETERAARASERSDKKGRRDGAPGETEQARAVASLTARTPLRPLSLGSPSEGRLENGIELAQSSVLKLKRPSGPRWGLGELIGLLERGAARVQKRFPGSVMLVGDLSRRRGGDVGGHRSHESGRDADVGFYFVDAEGRSAEPRVFRAVDWRGRAVDAPALRFDDARNWALVEAWVTDPGSQIEHIFVAEPIRARLLVYARGRGVYLPVLHRASMLLMQPTRGLPHDDHFHLRIACPRSQRGVCLADPPPSSMSKNCSYSKRAKRVEGAEGRYGGLQLAKSH